MNRFHFRRASTRGALLFLVGGATLLFGATKPARAESIRWASSFEAALREAKATRRPLMVDFYTDWCGWCKKLDAETYTDARVVAQARSFVSVKVNAEREGAQLARQYRVSSYPNIVFMNENGLVIDRFAGYLPGEGFAAAMGNVRARYRPSSRAASGVTSPRALPATRAQSYAKQRQAIARALKSQAYGRGKNADGEPIILRGGSTTQIDANGMILVRDTPPKAKPAVKKAARRKR